MKITAKTKLCMVIGDPVEHSLSPQMHNAGYERLGIDGEYVFVGCNVKPEDLGDFVSGIRAMRIKGVSCTRPHKLEIMKHLDEIDEVARKIGAVNTIVNDSGRLTGYNTDWIGVVASLETLTDLQGKRVALLGAGGAARAAAYGVTSKDVELTIYNRTLEKAQQLAELFGGKARSLNELEEVRSADIIINATSVGLSPDEDQTPLPKEFINEQQIVFDTIYTPLETRLMQEAKQQGAQVIPGTEMLLRQGLAQFKLFTGQEAPEEAMRNTLLQLLVRGRSK
jgi:shikimate dehydrogenase